VIFIHKYRLAIPTKIGSSAQRSSTHGTPSSAGMHREWHVRSGREPRRIRSKRKKATGLEFWGIPSSLIPSGSDLRSFPR